MLYRLFIVLLFLGFTSAQSWGWGDCCYQIEDDGNYCYENLTGYYYCDGQEDPWCMKTLAEVICPMGTRCSCHIDDWCRVNTSMICQPYESPAKFKESFSIVYQETTKFETTEVFMHYEVYNVSVYGFILRDPEQKRFFSMHAEKYTLIQEEKGKLIEYKWSRFEENKCKRRKFKGKQFPFPFPETKYLSRSDLKSTTKVGKKDLQEWYFRVGRDSWAFDVYQKWWKTLYDPEKDDIIPVQFYEKMVPGEFNKRHWKTITFKDHPIEFGLPDECKPGYSKPVAKEGKEESQPKLFKEKEKENPLMLKETFSISYINKTWNGPSELWPNAQITQKNVTKTGFFIRDVEGNRFISKIDDTNRLIQKEAGKLIEYIWYDGYEIECHGAEYTEADLPWPNIPDLNNVASYQLLTTSDEEDLSYSIYYQQIGNNQWKENVFQNTWSSSYDRKNDVFLEGVFHESLSRGGYGEMKHKMITFKHDPSIKFVLPKHCFWPGWLKEISLQRIKKFGQSFPGAIF